MSKFVRMIKNMSKVQKMVTLGVSTVVLCGAVVGGVLWYNHSSEDAKAETESYMNELVEKSDEMDSHDLRVALENVEDMDEETREILEKKLEEKVAKEDQTVATKPSEDEKEETKPSDDKKEETKPADKPSTGGDNSNNKPADKPSNGGSNNNGGSGNNKPSEPTKPVDPPKPEKPAYPAKGFDKSLTNKFNTRMLEQGFARDDSYTGMPAYTAIKNYALNKTPIPTSSLVHKEWGCKATGKVLTFTDTFKYTDDPAVWSESFTGGALTNCYRNYQTIYADYAICNSNGDGTFTVTVYTLDMTDL